MLALWWDLAFGRGSTTCMIQHGSPHEKHKISAGAGHEAEDDVEDEVEDEAKHGAPMASPAL